MTESVTTPTSHFGLTRINAGEAFSKDGWAFSDADRVRLDDLLYALANHQHTGEPPLGDPTDPCTFVAVSTGGHLPAATTFYYRASFIDRFGLETAASPEASVTTPNPIGPPAAPSATVEPSSGGLLPGTYSYLITYYDPYGGETTPSSINNVQVVSGTTNRIKLDFGTLGTGAAGIRIYRSRPGQSQFYFIGSLTSGSFYDDGIAEDQTITVNTVNTTNAANSIEVTIPGAFIPDGCQAWRIYRATASGEYDGNSLVHEVTEGVTDTSIVPRTMWVDTGDSLLPGFPQETGTTIGSGVLVTLNELAGSLELASIPRGVRILNFFTPGVVTDTQVLDITESPAPVKPARLTAFFKTPPDGTSEVTIRISDNAATPSYVDLVCDPPGATPVDPLGYYHVEWPLVEALEIYMSDPSAVDVSDPALVGLITDDISDTGQSMLLQLNGEWAQGNMGSLDPGTYRAYASLRTNELTTATNDIGLQVIRLDTNTQIAGANYTVTTTIGFAEIGPLSFTAPGGVPIVIRVSKVTGVAQTYEVQDVRFETSVPTLSAGLLTATALVDGGPTAAADVNVSLWF